MQHPICVLLITYQTTDKLSVHLPLCPKSKCTDFLFKCLLDSPQITSYLLQSMTVKVKDFVEKFMCTDDIILYYVGKTTIHTVQDGERTLVLLRAGYVNERSCKIS
jgi:hypothetical protein